MSVQFVVTITGPETIGLLENIARSFRYPGMRHRTVGHAAQVFAKDMAADGHSERQGLDELVAVNEAPELYAVCEAPLRAYDMDVVPVQPIVQFCVVH